MYFCNENVKKSEKNYPYFYSIKKYPTFTSWLQNFFFFFNSENFKGLYAVTKVKKGNFRDFFSARFFLFIATIFCITKTVTFNVRNYWNKRYKQLAVIQPAVDLKPF